VSVCAVADHAHTLAQAVDELLVLARNQAGGSCVWCGSRDLTSETPSELGDDLLIITCCTCGTELVSDRSPQVRGRQA